MEATVGKSFVDSLSIMVPLAVFLLAYRHMFRRSLIEPSFGRYTRWVYVQTLWLSPLMLFSPFARRLVIVNGLGMGFAIHCFYAITDYKLLREMGDRVAAKDLGIKKRVPMIVLLVGDAIVHFGVFALCSLLFWVCGAQASSFGLARLWIGCFTGFCHSTYCWFLTGSWDPTSLYSITKTKYTLNAVKMAWVGVFLGHVFSSWLIV